MSSLAENIKTINVINIDLSESTMSMEQLFSQQAVASSYVVSDVDEELLILVEFKQSVNLQLIKLYAVPQDDSSEMSPPKQIYVYKIDNLNKNFDDIKSLNKPDKAIKCSCKKLLSGQNVKLKNIPKFRKIQYLAILIESNQNETETTYLNGISFHGDHHKDNKMLMQKQEEIANINLFTKYRSQSHHKLQLDKSDMKNHQKLLEINEEYFNIEIQGFDSNRLLKHVDEDKNQDKNEESKQCTLNNCLAIKNISLILQDNTYGENVNKIQMLNDYHHLLFKHDDEFEDIYNILTRQTNDNQI
eukprot:392217_1